MSHKAARREYLEALAQFERSCRTFSNAMSELLEPPAPSEATMLGVLVRKPAKRARPAAPAIRRRAA